MKIKLDEGAFMPERAHETDAGLDLKTPIGFTVNPHSGFAVDTGVHVEIPKGCAGFLKSKSGLNVYHNITTEGVIDEGYTGAICVKVYNHGADYYTFHKGDKITQLVILIIAIPHTLEVVDEFEETERGSNGFGSTGK